MNLFKRKWQISGKNAPEPESREGLPAWALNPHTDDIVYVMHHPTNSQQKMVLHEDYILPVQNGFLRKLIPLPNFPQDKQEGVWIFKPWRDVYGKPQPTIEQHRKALGN